jgi:hypothetical protein
MQGECEKKTGPAANRAGNLILKICRDANLMRLSSQEISWGQTVAFSLV